jgi:hypothetical protein
VLNVIPGFRPPGQLLAPRSAFRNAGKIFIPCEPAGDYAALRDDSCAAHHLDEVRTDVLHLLTEQEAQKHL